MHEYHIVEELVAQVLKKAREGRARNIAGVTLVMGEHSGLEESSVRLYFENITRGTIAENARLIINPIAVKLACRSCAKEFERRGEDITCPQCGTMGILQKTGKEFYIDNIEIET